MQGVIKTIVPGKGFGFISREGETKDLFFHAKELVEGLVFEDLKVGDAVIFKVEETQKGPAATNVDRA
jgi:CspA family cold shock protein